MSQSITYVFTLALAPIVIAAVTILFMGKARVKTSQEMAKKRIKKAVHGVCHVLLFVYSAKCGARISFSTCALRLN